MKKTPITISPETLAQVENRESSYLFTLETDKRHEKLFAPYGVSFSVFRTLSYLLCRPEGAAPSQIADDLMILRQSMTNILDGLESRGLVERLADPKDRRRLQVRLLDAGQELAAALLEEENAYSSRIYDYMGEDDLREYRRLERKMYEAKVAALRDILEERNQ